MTRAGGDERMDFSALERLCAFMTTPAHQLRELTIASNHLLGLSRFHSGQRNEAGLNHLLDGLKSEDCKLTHLDVSGNALSHEDAAQLLAVALQERSAVRELKVHQWLVPVTRLAADTALDLRAQQIEEADATPEMSDALVKSYYEKMWSGRSGIGFKARQREVTPPRERRDDIISSAEALRIAARLVGKKLLGEGRGGRESS